MSVFYCERCNLLKDSDVIELYRVNEQDVCEQCITQVEYEKALGEPTNTNELLDFMSKVTKEFIRG